MMCVHLGFCTELLHVQQRVFLKELCTQATSIFNCCQVRPEYEICVKEKFTTRSPTGLKPCFLIDVGRYFKIGVIPGTCKL